MRAVATALRPPPGRASGAGVLAWWAACGAPWCVAGCAGRPVLEPRVVHGEDDAPFEGASSVEVSVEQAGVPVAGARTRQPFPSATFAIDRVPFGADLQLRVEVLAGDVVLARGRSYPFDLLGTEDRPPAADVLVGTLGRFSRTLAVADALVAIAPTRGGALVATDDGRVLSYVAHGDGDGGAVLVEGARVPARAGASWVRLAPAQGDARLLAVGGAAPGATLFGADGTVRAELGSVGLDATREHALAAAGDGRWVVVVGGRDAGGTPRSEVVRIDVAESALALVSLPSLATPRAGDGATTLEVEEAARTREMVIVGGGTPGELLLVDPLGAPTRVVAVDAPLRARALVGLERGLVLAAGGRDALDAPSDAIDLYVVRPDQSPPIAEVSPPLAPLFTPRAGAVAERLAAGLALVVGGEGLAGPTRAAELVEVRLDALPGTVVPTGTLPIAASVRAAARLADRSVLVVGDGLAASFVPPRGPE